MTASQSGPSEYDDIVLQQSAWIGTPNALNPLIFAAYPSLEYDSWVTIGLDQVPDLVAGEAAVRPFRMQGRLGSRNSIREEAWPVPIS